MKRIVLLISLVAALTLCAGAQTFIDFHEMPIAKTPQTMPDNYPSTVNLYWDNFFYVTPGLWTGEGPGFWVDPATLHNSVAFVGGPMCPLTVPCTSSLKMDAVQPNAKIQTFTPVSMSVSAGWAANNVIITAYNHGYFVGQMTLKLTTTPHTFSFPATWKVTQLAFTPTFIPTNAIYPKAGSMVIYSFVLMQH
ncbi:MAG: hypothetical protein WA655_05910 [Candidatus Korobacteraceae bacterium]